MSDWISVEDRLPNQGDFVVALHVYDHIEEPESAVCWFLDGVFTPYTDGLSATDYSGRRVNIELDMDVNFWKLLKFPKPLMEN